MNSWDVIVIGCGNAGACAAISAQQQGAKVLIIEKTRKESRGGNTTFSSGIFGFPNDGIDDVKNLITDLSEEETMKISIPSYTKDDFYRDLMRCTQNKADPELTELLVNEARPTIEWMTKLGIKWEIYDPYVRYKGIRYYGPGSPVRARGGGPGLIDMEFETMESKDIDVMYETTMVKLLVDDAGRVVGAKVKDAEGKPRDLAGKAVVLCAGSFTANPEMRAKYLGKNWDLAKVRGSKYNTGEVLAAAMEISAQPGGHWSGVHCAQIHADAPDLEADAWDKRRSLYSWYWGILVNKDGKRFVDEAESYQEYTYAKFGRIIFETQPDAIAYQVFDSKPLKGKDDLLLSSYYQQWISFIEANTLEELAEELGMDPDIIKNTIEEYNAAIAEDVDFDPSKLDGKSTRGIMPQKSNWARKIDTPPFYAFPVTGGIGFTLAGLKINRRCEVLDLSGKSIKGLYAAGELAGGFYYFSYLGGSGLMKGAVTGKIAGANAAGYAASS